MWITSECLSSTSNGSRIRASHARKTRIVFLELPSGHEIEIEYSEPWEAEAKKPWKWRYSARSCENSLNQACAGAPNLTNVEQRLPQSRPNAKGELQWGDTGPRWYLFLFSLGQF